MLVPAQLTSSEIKMQKKKVRHITELLQDSKRITPEQTLQKALEDLEPGERAEKCNKIIVIMLESNEDTFVHFWRQSGMTASEIIALCEVVKEEMRRYILP